MFPQPVRKLMRGSAAAAFVFVASVVFAPSRAEASCGDYVMIGGQHGQSAYSSHGMPPSHDPAKPPCHGPSCSNHSLPPAAPAPRIEVTVEQWAIPCGLHLCQSPQASSPLADTRDVPSDGYVSSILRPPR